MFISALMSMGVFVSPVARKTAPNTEIAARNSMGAQTMARYSEASRRISGAPPSQRGRKGLRGSMITVSAPPTISVSKTDCMAACRARSSSFAPMEMEMQERTPMPAAAMGAWVSHMVVVVRPMAADA